MLWRSSCLYLRISFGHVTLVAITVTLSFSHVCNFLTHPPEAVHMRWWNGTALVQMMVCRLLDAKLLPETMQAHCQLDPQQQT